MSRNRREECLDIFRPGEISLRLEVSRNGRARLECPCCEGCGSHSDRPGNNPDALEYDCDTCCGTGDIIQMPELEQPPAWRGASQNGPGSNSRPT